MGQPDKPQSFLEQALRRHQREEPPVAEIPGDVPGSAPSAETPPSPGAADLPGGAISHDGEAASHGSTRAATGSVPGVADPPPHPLPQVAPPGRPVTSTPAADITDISAAVRIADHSAVPPAAESGTVPAEHPGVGGQGTTTEPYQQTPAERIGLFGPATAAAAPDQRATASADTLETPEEVVAPARELTTSELALVDEAMKKSALVWVQTPTAPAGRAVWHAWTAGTMYVVTGIDEQPSPGVMDGSDVSIVVRSKDTTSRLISFGATVTTLDPTSEDWPVATAELIKARLNLHDSKGAAARWGSDSGYQLYRLTPNGHLSEHPGAYSDASHRAAPVPTTATTVGPKPKILHRRHGSGRPLS